jgi:hypothetical protein
MPSIDPLLGRPGDASTQDVERPPLMGRGWPLRHLSDSGRAEQLDPKLLATPEETFQEAGPKRDDLL